MAAKITFTVDQNAERELAHRAKRLKPSGPPVQLNSMERAIHFVRGVSSRATIALPAFYLLLGTRAEGDQSCAIPGYPGVVFKHAMEFSSVSTVSLCCRKAFDNRAKGLTGGNFARITDVTLERVGEYWATKSSRPYEEALAALVLLRSVFEDCSKANQELLNAVAPLGRRVALLKQYADRSAAHLSLESYEFSIIDCAHVVAALTLIGEIIRSFDNPQTPSTYFNDLDKASFEAARQLFPSTPEKRLFDHIDVEMQSRLCWQWGIERGRQMLLEQLPYAISWF